MKITIVTPVFNAEKTLEQSILSVVNQSYNNIEYIIIDGCSTDGSLDIIKKYEESIDYWISEPDKGIFDAMNKSIRKATGDYIYFLGADDSLVSKNIIQEIVQYLGERVDILSAPVWLVNEEYKIQRINFNKCDKISITEGGMIPHQGMFVKLQLMKEMPFNNNFRYASDYEFLLKCVLQNKYLKCIEIPVAYYCDSGASSANEEAVIYEYQQIMHECGIPEEVVNKNLKRKCQRKSIGSKIKDIRNYVLRNISMHKKYFLIKNKDWQEHHCSNEKCRWCSKK